MSRKQSTANTHATVTIVLPARNEEAAIGKTLRCLPVATLRALGLETDVVVLDGHSKDRTAEIAAAWGARVIPDREDGKGSAFRNAIPHFRGDYVVMLDADNTYAADAIPRILGPLIRGEADVAMGNRTVRPGAMSGVHLLGNAMLSLVATILYTRKCPDLCTGLWGFRTDALRSLPLESNGFGLEAELFGLSTRTRLRMVQVRSDYLPRGEGAAKLSFGHDGLRIVRRLVIARFAPVKEKRRSAGHPPTPHPSSGREVPA